MISLVAIIASMPLIAGQQSGLLAGLSLLAFYVLVYLVIRKRYLPGNNLLTLGNFRSQTSTEFDEE